ncbi:hypothetical protein CEXT_425161 [Caerostris extrusa]|uniref:Uncharacterized protein n=1 Tax=Caerostris extrusa TaxID=172846 RepID=A0AAV4QYP9_CAEEX|nr:hypothetical protein CEXT_425161 [Caerostris extrusa]
MCPFKESHSPRLIYLTFKTHPGFLAGSRPAYSTPLKMGSFKITDSNHSGVISHFRNNPSIVVPRGRCCCMSSFKGRVGSKKTFSSLCERGPTDKRADLLGPRGPIRSTICPLYRLKKPDRSWGV